MSHTSRSNRLSIAILAYDRLCIFEFGIALEIFGLPRPDLHRPWYTTRVCSLERNAVHALGGVKIHTEAGLRALQQAGTIVIPGWRDPDEVPPAPLLKALRAAHANGARLVSICTGAFALAATGLVDGKRIATHWMYADRLAQRYPRVQVDANVIFIDQGQIVSSAGSAAGVDVCLHIVRKDFGAEVANQVARRLVMPPQREGGQAQYVSIPARVEKDAGFAPMLEWMQQRLAEPLSVTRMAHHAAMSPRTFARRFHESTGTSPHRWLTHQRVLAAQRLLETTDASIDEVAQAVGLSTAAVLRHHFTRALSVNPTAYRRRFAHPKRRSARG